MRLSFVFRGTALGLVALVATACGKNPVVITDSPTGTWGFVANRVYMAMIKEANACIDEGIATREHSSKKESGESPLGGDLRNKKAARLSADGLSFTVHWSEDGQNGSSAKPQRTWRDAYFCTAHPSPVRTGVFFPGRT